MWQPHHELSAQPGGRSPSPCSHGHRDVMARCSLSVRQPKSMQVAYATYIDPLCPATPACYRFFGWLLPPSLADLPVDAQVSAAAFAVGL